MKHVPGRFYATGALILTLGWIGWWILTFAGDTDREAGIRLLGFIFIDAVFLVFGLTGLVLAYKRRVLYELAAAAASLPFANFIALIAPPGLREVISIFWLALLLIFSVVAWHRQSLFVPHS